MKKNQTKNKTQLKIYTSYSKRIIILTLLFLISFSACVFLSLKVFEYKKPSSIKYSENSDIEYKVFLKSNDFYDKEYLEKNMVYIANLIDYIDIDFSYIFKIHEKTDIDFNYEIIGNLVIEDESGNLKYFEKEYNLLNNKVISLSNNNEKSIHEKIKIDYQLYNSLANSFKTKYGVNTSSYLNVYLKVNKESSSDDPLTIDSDCVSSINIPLSEKSISIHFDVDDSNNVKEAFTNSKVVFSKKKFIFSLIFFIVSLLLFVNLIKMVIKVFSKKSPYDKFISKVLKEYDRLIVETKTPYDKDLSNVIEINSFDELLDARDNLKLPIMYYNITKHQKCYFYIKNQQDIYLFKLKAVDLEQHDKKSI